MFSNEGISCSRNQHAVTYHLSGQSAVEIHQVMKFSSFLVFCFINQSCLSSSQGRVKSDYDGVRILTGTGSHNKPHLKGFSEILQGYWRRADK